MTHLITNFRNDRLDVRVLLGALVVLVVVACSLAGQDQPVTPQQPSEMNEPPVLPSIFAREKAAQMDADVARLTSMLEGSWKTVADGSASESDPEAETQTLWMHMLPVETEMLGRVIYVEVHRDGSPWLPIRQAMMRVYRYGDRLRLRTYEFRDPARPEVLANLWLAPEHFPAQYIQPDELIPTMDIELDRGRGGYQGRTPHAYPTTRESAVEMTVELSVKPDELISTDTFYGVGGQPIEGAGATLRFERAQLPASVQVDDDGLVIITLVPGETDGPKTTEGDVLFLNYEGFRADGFKFDSSWDRGLAMRTLYPPRVIAGLKRGMEPWVQGMRRKLIIPPELGFGMAETKDVPGGTTLVFHGHLIRVDQGEPMPMEERTRRQDQP